MELPAVPLGGGQSLIQSICQEHKGLILTLYGFFITGQMDQALAGDANHSVSFCIVIF